MADENTKEPKPKMGLDVKIILAGLVVFLLAIGASYFLMKSLMAPLLPHDESNNKKEISSETLVPVGEFATNVEAVAGNRYLKVEIVIGTTDKKAQESIGNLMPVIKDSILTILQSKTVADLDVRNRDNLKEELREDINEKLGSEMVTQIFFTNFIMN